MLVINIISPLRFQLIPNQQIYLCWYADQHTHPKMANLILAILRSTYSPNITQSNTLRTNWIIFKVAFTLFPSVFIRPKMKNWDFCNIWFWKFAGLLANAQLIILWIQRPENTGWQWQHLLSISGPSCSKPWLTLSGIRG